MTKRNWRLTNFCMQKWYERHPNRCGALMVNRTKNIEIELPSRAINTFQNQRFTLSVFSDTQKAFNKVWKNGLLMMLQCNGIKGKVYCLTKNHLHNRRFKELVDGHCSWQRYLMLIALSYLWNPDMKCQPDTICYQHEILYCLQPQFFQVFRHLLWRKQLILTFLHPFLTFFCTMW